MSRDSSCYHEKSLILLTREFGLYIWSTRKHLQFNIKRVLSFWWVLENPSCNIFEYTRAYRAKLPKYSSKKGTIFCKKLVANGFSFDWLLSKDKFSSSMLAFHSEKSFDNFIKFEFSWMLDLTHQASELIFVKIVAQPQMIVIHSPTCLDD